ncbi:MAG: putative DNA binding domain-containing protein [Phycisphaerae bacterium]|nr:putative DNA binding domain-containing protein [Phycisphaerae bacterium]
MTDAELEKLLANTESDRAERKESPADGDRIRQVICAFANDLPGHGLPGVLFVGVDDAGEPVGLDITDQLLQNLASMRGDGLIVPFPSLDVQKRTLKGRDVAVVIVYPAYAPPVRFRGAVWIRTGPRRGIANADDERRLNEKRRYRDPAADIAPIYSAGLDLLDEYLFRRIYLPASQAPEVLAQNQRSLEHQLLAVKFAHDVPPACATRLGLLTVGIKPTDWISGAYIQFLRIAGTKFAGPVKNQLEIRGPLPDLFHQLDIVLKSHIQTSADFTSGPLEIRISDYPIAALEQITRNAILHRAYENTNAPVHVTWYDDRVEVRNPGGPYGTVTKANFGQPGIFDYRNPNLAGVMKELKYVQRFGHGIQATRDEMQANGNPPPEFLVDDSFVTVILRKRT